MVIAWGAISCPIHDIRVISALMSTGLIAESIDASAAPAPYESTLDRARNALLALQYPKGYWVGELQGDSILESEYILLKFILSQESDPRLPKVANYLRGLQQPHGGWSLFPGGPADLSGTVKAYFSLKLMGDDPASPHMQIARRVILSLGGA